MDQLPPLNGLRAFEASGQYLSFRAAADALGVTQGAVAQQVRALEAHLGMPLFERLPKGLAFTLAGRGYHARVQVAFEELREATKTLRPQPGKVLISVTPTFAAKWLIPNLAAFSQAHPDIDLRVLATERVSSFHSDGINLAVRQGQPPFGSGVEASHLFPQEIIAIAAPPVMAGRSLPLAPDELAEMPKLHDAHDLWPEYLARFGFHNRSDSGVRLSQTSLAIDAALAGQGVALVGRFLVARDIEEGRLVQIRPEVLVGQNDFYLLAEKPAKRSKASDAVHQWLLSIAEKQID
ncbi:LysR substrate-binding domain-containing protein [Roseovarius sp. EL26]|uniref:LysR substrate-binding domain-containing protein n=1 Tax=Roseovarius sp. EL26 TaxID=2126672 RepID=UPI000EA3DB4A|nr:LysR substrate-binding domain-containing protein [Roseovarius sp. EL26]